MRDMRRWWAARAYDLFISRAKFALGTHDCEVDGYCQFIHV